MTQPVGHDDAARESALIMRSNPGCQTAVEDTLILHQVIRSVGEQNFEHWFQNRTRFQVQNDRLIVRVANPFILNWLLKRFRTQLSAAARSLLGECGSCHLEVDAELQSGIPAVLHQPAALRGLTGQDSAQSITSVRDPGHNQDFGRLADRPSEKLRSEKHRNDSAATPLLPGSFQTGGHSSGKRRFRTFESFVTGESNSLAALAARQVSSAPGERFNPLYIHGGTGTGKTHLLEAIYSEIRRRRPQATVVYLTSESFTNYFTSALSSRTVPSFRQRFRSVDVLLIDNIEFLDNKRATQEEFLHTIVQVAEHGGQVVISSDRHPRLLNRHREELTTRFMSGLVCRLESPDEATCRQIVQSLTAGLNATFSDEVIEYIARRCRRNIREIQGALNSLDGHVSLSGSRKITLNTVRQILGDMTSECRKLIRIQDVEKVVCEAFGVSASELRSDTRRRSISIPRSVAMFLSRKHTCSAYREIGLYFGGRDHSTVVAAEKRIAEALLADEPVNLPNTCAGRTMTAILDELECRIACLAS